MRRIRWFVVLLVAAILLIGCGSSKEEEKETVFSEWVGAEKYIIDTENDTIVHEGTTYRYEITGNSNDYLVKIIFPDDSYYSMHYEKNGSLGTGWVSTSANFDGDSFITGDLVDLVEEKEGIPGEKPAFNLRIGYVILGVLFIGIGIANVRNPHFFWKWEFGWRFKNAEPSDLALTMERIGGCIGIVIGVVCLFLSFT